MQLKKIFAWSALLILLSCEKDIKVKAPSQEVKLVVNSITAINRPFTATIGKTAGILDLTTPQSYLVNNAIVLLYENNVVKDTLTYNSSTGIYKVRNNTMARAGFRYQMKASATGFNSAEAETSLPANIRIESITRRFSVRTDSDSTMHDEIKIRFTDDGTISNYYLMKFRRPFNNGRDIHYEDMYCIRSLDTDIDRRTDIDPILFEDCIDRELMLSDKHFNGRVKELSIFIRSHELEPVLNPANGRQYKAVIELNNITADQYKYRKSYRAYRDSDGNPFAEPVLVYTNIKNGYGLFSAYNLAIDTIR
jgi:hypothetical protein